jgi:hypothetical protein
VAIAYSVKREAEKKKKWTYQSYPKIRQTTQFMARLSQQ